MAYAIGHISGCHLNPAVSAGLVAAKRFPISDLPAYVIAQVLGGIAGAGVLHLIASGNSDFSLVEATRREECQYRAEEDDFGCPRRCGQERPGQERQMIAEISQLVS